MSSPQITTMLGLAACCASAGALGTSASASSAKGAHFITCLLSDGWSVQGPLRSSARLDWPGLSVRSLRWARRDYSHLPPVWELDLGPSPIAPAAPRPAAPPPPPGPPPPP